MKTTIEKNNSTMTVIIVGRVDTTTAPALEREIKENIECITELIMDFSGVAYISSAGLRVLLGAQKIMNKQGSMVIKGANADIMEIFEVTGFADILTIA